MKKTFWTMILVTASGSQLGSTDCGQVIRDPGFDLWCGDQLCAWKTERGDIKKVATWNQGDPGVEFIGTDVAIEQLTPVTGTTCIEFDLIANVDTTATVELNIDLDGDGTVEHTERISGANWKPFSYLLAFNPYYSGIRFEIAKTGPGRAMVAQVQAKVADDGACAGLAPIVAAPAPNGAVCTTASACRSGICGDGTQQFAFQCVGCDSNHPCPTGQTCGLGDPTSPIFAVPLECVPTAARQLGENCVTGAECASGVCTGQMCSTCDAQTNACAAGESCGPDWVAAPGATSIVSPFVCSPLQHKRTTGQPCASNDDCASSACDGTPRMQCDDGRACATAADCPFGGPDTGNGLQNGPCNTVGVQGGSCR
jgi:hypothetical protein